MAMLGGQCSACCGSSVVSLCGCDDISKASRVSFALSFSGFTSTGRFGRDVNTTECSAQYGFNSGYNQFEPPESSAIRTAILNQWKSWLNSLTPILSFDANASALAGFLVWKGQSETTTPFGSSAVVPFIATACGVTVRISHDEGSCFSQGPIVYPTLSRSFNLSSGACTSTVNTQTQLAFSRTFWTCALTSSSGCATFGAEAEAYGFAFEGWCSIETRFNLLP
jgi:hypothetical protein